MKKTIKITGIIALTFALALNLQYALFNYDLKDNPNGAFAAWIDSDNGITYCGSEYGPDPRYTMAGTWEYTPYGYDTYTFYHNSYGTQCGRYDGDTTSQIPNGGGYQY